MGGKNNLRSLGTNIVIHNATLIVMCFSVVLVVVDEVLCTLCSAISMLVALFDPLTFDALLELLACGFGDSSAIVLFLTCVTTNDGFSLLFVVNDLLVLSLCRCKNLNALQFHCRGDDFQFVRKQGCYRVFGILSGASCSPGIDCETCIGNMSYRIWEYLLNTCPHSNVFTHVR